MTFKFVLSLLVFSTFADAQLPDFDMMRFVAAEFFDCCETGKGWAGCSQFVTNENAPFSVQAVDALPGPKVTDNRDVKGYLDWMAGVVKEFGPKATYFVNARDFDTTTMTAMFFATFGGFSDYVYMIQICPKEMKVRGMTKVWNDQYALNNMQGLAEPMLKLVEQPQLLVQAPDFRRMAHVSQEFFDCCEAGKGWAGCSQFVASENAPFSVEAVDALPGPKVTDSKDVKDYLNWMAGVVKEFGPKATYEVKAHGFDTTTMTAMYYAVFGGFSEYVYVIQMCPKEMKVRGMTKVWNDKYAASHMPGSQEPVLKLAERPPAITQALNFGYVVFLGIACGFVGAALVLLAWVRYTRIDQEQAYLQFE